MLDLIIVGASAAGISASIYAARRRLNFKIVSWDIGGEMATSGEIENWPGIVHTTGIELTDLFKQQLKANGIVVEDGKRVKEIKPVNNFFILTGQNPDGSSFTEQTKTVLVTTGVHPRLLNVPGEKEFRNKGVSYCTVCDGPLFSGKVVATIGGGNSALESAIMLADIAAQVYVLNKNPVFKGEAVLIDKLAGAKNIKIIYEALTQKIIGDKFVTGLEYKDKTGETHSLKAEGIFVHIGMVPNSDFMPGLALNELKEIRVDRFGRTGLAGLYAAGDVVDQTYRQLAISAGQGVTALLAIVDYLNKNH